MAMASDSVSNKKEVHPSGGGARVWMISVALAITIAIGSWFYTAIQPPEPKLCGSEGGPPVTAPRIRLRDGRFLAYAEIGVPKDQARYKIVFCHGFSSTRLDAPRASPEGSDWAV